MGSEDEAHHSGSETCLSNIEISSRIPLLSIGFVKCGWTSDDVTPEDARENWSNLAVNYPRSTLQTASAADSSR